jgi:enamine deaminase RidA (YjgF/YER057c/UK114 family)
MHKNLQPPGWPRPSGYSNGSLAKGEEMIFISGQIGWNASGKFEHVDFPAQVRQALTNVMTILNEAGANGEHIVRMTWYITDKQAYLSNLKAVGRIYRETVGHYFPPMSVVEVSALIEDEARVEIEVTAVK